MESIFDDLPEHQTPELIVDLFHKHGINKPDPRDIRAVKFFIRKLRLECRHVEYDFFVERIVNNLLAFKENGDEDIRLIFAFSLYYIDDLKTEYQRAVEVAKNVGMNLFGQTINPRDDVMWSFIYWLHSCARATKTMLLDDDCLRLING